VLDGNQRKQKEVEGKKSGGAWKGGQSKNAEVLQFRKSEGGGAGNDPKTQKSRKAKKNGVNAGMAKRDSRLIRRGKRKERC